MLCLTLISDYYEKVRSLREALASWAELATTWTSIWASCALKYSALKSDGFMMLAAVAKLLSHTLKQSYVVFTAPWAEMWNMARVWSHFKANDMLSKKATSYELEHLKFLQAARSFTAQCDFFLPFRSGGISGTRVSIPGTVWVSGKAAVCTSLPIRVTSVQRELNKSIPGTDVQLLLQIRQSKLIRSVLQVATVKSSLLQCHIEDFNLILDFVKQGNNSSFSVKCFSWLNVNWPVPIHRSNTAKRKGTAVLERHQHSTPSHL